MNSPACPTPPCPLTAPRNSPSPDGCPTIQLNSVAIYLEITLYPQSYGLSLVRVPPPQYSEVNCQHRLLPIDYRLEVPITPSLGLINLLKWLTKLREILYLPNYRFTVKWFNSRTARWKRCIGQGMGKLLRASKPSSQPLIRVHRPGSSPVELLWRLLTQAWFIKSTPPDVRG